MNTKSCFHRVVAIASVCFAVAWLSAQDQTITGNLTVTGSIGAGGPIDSNDNTLSFGAQGGSFGAALIHQDSGTDTFTFLSNRNPASWLWQHTVGIAAMRLDSGHQLILYQSDGTTAGITLIPSSSAIKLGTHANGTLTADANGVITAGGGFAVAGGFTNTNGTLTGGASGLTLNAGGTDQAISINPSGTGDVNIGTSAAGGDIVMGNSSTVTLAGHIRPHSHNAFDLGLSLQRWRSVYVHGTTATGDLVVDTGIITGGATGLSLAAGDVDQSITLSAQGAGVIALQSPLRVTTAASALAQLSRTGTTPNGVGLAVTADDTGPSLETVASHNLKIRVNGAEAGRFVPNGSLLLGTETDGSNGRLQLASHTTADGGVGFGPDTTLYRSAAGTLKTDGKLVAGSGRFDGPVRIAPQGDLSMGEFTSEPQ